MDFVRWVVSIGRGWNWLRVESRQTAGFAVSGAEPSGTVSKAGSHRTTEYAKVPVTFLYSPKLKTL
jgi:hypothetical protein